MYKVGQAVAVASLFLSLKDPGHHDGAGFICVLCLPIRMEIKILTSVKSKSILSYGKLCEPEEVYIVFVRS